MTLEPRSRRLKKKQPYLLLLLIFLLMLFSMPLGQAVYRHLAQSSQIVVLTSDGKLTLKEYSWLYPVFYSLEFRDGAWSWCDSDGNWQKLALPYNVADRTTNEGLVAVLAKGGEIYLRPRDNSDRYPLRVEQNVWFYYKDGFWQPVPVPAQ